MCSKMESNVGLAKVTSSSVISPNETLVRGLLTPIVLSKVFSAETKLLATARAKDFIRDHVWSGGFTESQQVEKMTQWLMRSFGKVHLDYIWSHEEQCLEDLPEPYSMMLLSDKEDYVDFTEEEEEEEKGDESGQEKGGEHQGDVELVERDELHERELNRQGQERQPREAQEEEEDAEKEDKEVLPYSFRYIKKRRPNKRARRRRKMLTPVQVEEEEDEDEVSKSSSIGDDDDKDDGDWEGLNRDIHMTTKSCIEDDKGEEEDEKEMIKIFPELEFEFDQDKIRRMSSVLQHCPTELLPLVWPETKGTVRVDLLSKFFIGDIMVHQH